MISGIHGLIAIPYIRFFHWKLKFEKKREKTTRELKNVINILIIKPKSDAFSHLLITHVSSLSFKFDEMNTEEIENTFLLRQLSVWNCIRSVELFQMLEDVNFFKRNYTVRPRLDPFVEYDEREFERRYRLSKALVKKLYLLLDSENLLEPQVNFTFSPAFSCTNGFD